MVLCSNCHCDIEEAKIFLHERFCVQNIKYCEQCKEGIVKEEYEDHCQNHNKKIEEKKRPSQELRRSLTLQRVESSKIGCQYCGYFCGYSDIEEHESMCGARTTNCKKCGKILLYKNLKSHIEKEHKLDLDNYKQMSSQILDVNTGDSSTGLTGNFGDLSLKRMTTDEEIAYALALSQEEEQRRKNEENKNIKSNIMEKNSSCSLNKQKSDKIDYDELDYEYEKEMYEREMEEYK